MSSGIDVKYVQESYEKMSDAELTALTTDDAGGLTPEALEIARNELKKRGLNPHFAAVLDAQNKSYSIEEIDYYCSLINGLNCPICGNGTDKLNAALTAEVMSFIVVTLYQKKNHVGCPDCLDKLTNAALIKTIAFGWWGFPFGIIRSIQAISLNFKSKQNNRVDSPNQHLRSFVLSNIVQLELNKDNPAKLNQLISEMLK
jgi:hypothetical protein